MIPESEVFGRLGEAGFERLVSAFYTRVAVDDLIGRMYPPEELLAAKDRLRDFLIQRFGGPPTYSERRGHPRLRMRHGPFSIGEPERDRWLELMRGAMEDAKVDPDVAETIWPYFVNTANFMMNRG